MPLSNLGKQISIKSLWPLLLPILLLLPALSSFPYPSQGALYSDLSVTHYPNAVFLRQSIAEWGQIPLWSPTILSGYPFAANPLSCLWYPPGWLAQLLPLPLGFNVVVIIHLLVGGVGMYLLLRAFGRSHRAAIFAALAFEAMPKVFADYGAGHLTMVYAISLTPWLLLAEMRGWTQAGIFWLRQPGILLGLIALADPRWAVYAGLLWLAFAFVANEQTRAKKVLGFLKQSLISLAIAAPLLLPLLEYSQLSTRAQLSPIDMLAYSFPPAGLIGVLAPQLGGFHEWIIYVGVSVLLLAIITIVGTNKDKLDWLWIGIAVAALLFSMGEYIPGMSQLLIQLLGFSFLRVPARILPIVGVAIIVLAGGALDHLFNRGLGQKGLRRTRLAFTGLIASQVSFVVISWFLTGQIPTAFVSGLIISLIFLIVIFLFLTKRIPVKLFWVSLMALTLFDLGVMDLSLFEPRPKESVLAEGGQAAEFLVQQPGQFRVYSPSYSIPQQTAAEYGLDLAGGVDPLQLQSYIDFMEEATDVKSAGYSVTLPYFSNGKPAVDNQSAVPDVAKLSLLNIGYIASEFEMNVDGLEFIDKLGSTFIYRLVETLPRAYISGNPEKAVSISKWTPNRIEITAEGPGRLVLSEVMYPGWVANVDGKWVDIETFEGILRSVDLTDGIHTIVFEFHSISVYMGLGIFSIGVIYLAIDWQRQKKVKK